MNAGSADIAAAADALRSRLPAPLGALAPMAYNYRWSWTSGAPDLLASIDPRRWEACGGNPVRLLQEVHPDTLERLAGDQPFLERLATLERRLADALQAPLNEGRSRPSGPPPSSAPSTGIHGSPSRSTPAASACWRGTSSRRPPTSGCRSWPSA